MLAQVVYKEQQDEWQALSAAAQEIDEMHALLLEHHQRIPTVDTVRTLFISNSHVKHSLSLTRQMTARFSKRMSTSFSNLMLYRRYFTAGSK